jgi:hypothetical protein
MTYELISQGDGTTRVTIDYGDEGIQLQGTTHVAAEEDAAQAYVAVFDRDLRTNYWHLFPTPPAPEPEEVEM